MNHSLKFHIGFRLNFNTTKWESKTSMIIDVRFKERIYWGFQKFIAIVKCNKESYISRRDMQFLDKYSSSNRILYDIKNKISKHRQLRMLLQIILWNDSTLITRWNVRIKIISDDLMYTYTFCIQITHYSFAFFFIFKKLILKWFNKKD